jgi:hypothetical protein
MLPVILGAAALAGGAASAYSNHGKNKDTRNAYGKVGEEQDRLYDEGQGIADAHDWRARMNAANQMTRDANAYEINNAIQGGLAAYGGSPLSGNARNAVYDRLQQQARGNWRQGLDDANSMLGMDAQMKLGLLQNHAGRKMAASGALADAKAAEKSGFASFLEGAGNTLGVASKVASMG